MMMFQRKSVGLYVFLTIITCGLFGLYWIVSVANDANIAAQEPGTPGGVVLILTIITCGIYGWYFLYQAGQKIRIAQMKRNFPYVSDQSIVYLILAIFGLSIISYALIQNELNKIADSDMMNGQGGFQGGYM